MKNKNGNNKLPTADCDSSSSSSSNLSFRWVISEEGDDDADDDNVEACYWQWVNDTYKSIKFRPSTKDDVVLVAEITNVTESNYRSITMTTTTTKVGLGRLVQIPKTKKDKQQQQEEEEEEEGCGDDWELGGIYVIESFRKRGIAREIVTRLISKAKEKAAIQQQQYGEEQQQQKKQSTGSILWCIPFEHLQEFYKSCGFEQVQNYKNKLDTLPGTIQCKLSGCASTFPDTPTTLLKLDL